MSEDETRDDQAFQSLFDTMVATGDMSRARLRYLTRLLLHWGAMGHNRRTVATPLAIYSPGEHADFAEGGR